MRRSATLYIIEFHPPMTEGGMVVGGMILHDGAEVHAKVRRSRAGIDPEFWGIVEGLEHEFAAQCRAMGASFVERLHDTLSNAIRLTVYTISVSEDTFDHLCAAFLDQ